MLSKSDILKKYVLICFALPFIAQNFEVGRKGVILVYNIAQNQSFVQKRIGENI